VALALVAGAASWFWLGSEDPLGVAPLFSGGPRLAADTDTIDFGDVRFDKMVTASFRLRNVGDKPLMLASNPPVEVAEGC
jgi:hypothetical protein